MTTEAYVEFLFEHMAPLGEITSKRMFGGYCLYCDGVVFALVAGNTLYLKVDAETKPKFQARGLEQFRPFESEGTMMNYFQPPAEFFEHADAMAEWGGLAVAAGRRGSKPKNTANKAASKKSAAKVAAKKK